MRMNSFYPENQTSELLTHPIGQSQQNDPSNPVTL